MRLQQQSEAVSLSHQVRHRRDVCFSQALTTLVTGIMAKLWCSNPDPQFLAILVSLGPLVSFEGLLSLHGEDVAIFNDMIVAVEDLRNVEFNLIVVDKRSKVKLRSKSGCQPKPADRHAADQDAEQLSPRPVRSNTEAEAKAETKPEGKLEVKPEPSVSRSHILEYHTLPLPRVTGSRSSLKGLFGSLIDLTSVRSS
jgi:hypothetical protein